MCYSNTKMLSVCRSMLRYFQCTSGVIVVLIVICSITSKLSSKTLCVSPQGSDVNSGTSALPFQSIKKAIETATRGDTVYLLEGEYTLSASILINKQALDDKRIIVQGQSRDKVCVKNTGEVFQITCPYITLKDMTLNGNWGVSDILRVKTNSNYFEMHNLEIKNTHRDAVDISANSMIRIYNCKIYNALWFQGATQVDAHGIVTGGVKNCIIKNTEIFHVSGDAIQFQYGGWDSIVVENCKLWNGPLDGSNGDTLAGKIPGENAIDTKYYTADGRGHLWVYNTIAYGWKSDFITNAAAFNIKHNVEVVFDRITTYDNEIGFRLRGPVSQGEAWVTIKNACIYDCEKAVRYEDAINHLHIYNCTFGQETIKFFESAGGFGTDFQVKNNLFLTTTKPQEATHASNLSVNSSAFLNSSQNDYHLALYGTPINKGEVITEVVTDRDSVQRSLENGFDVGAYEFTPVSINNVHYNSTPLVTDNTNTAIKYDIKTASILLSSCFIQKKNLYSYALITSKGTQVAAGVVTHRVIRIADVRPGNYLFILFPKQQDKTVSLVKKIIIH